MIYDTLSSSNPFHTGYNARNCPECGCVWLANPNLASETVQSEESLPFICPTCPGGISAYSLYEEKKKRKQKQKAKKRKNKKQKKKNLGKKEQKKQKKKGNQNKKDKQMNQQENESQTNIAYEEFYELPGYFSGNMPKIIDREQPIESIRKCKYLRGNKIEIRQNFCCIFVRNFCRKIRKSGCQQ